MVTKAMCASQERIVASVRERSPAERTQLMTLLDKLMAGMLPPGGGPAPMLFQDDDGAKKRRRTPRRAGK
jgi:hypothetical protein